MILAVNAVPGREIEVFDALNETLRALVQEGAVDDTDDQGWTYLS